MDRQKNEVPAASKLTRNKRRNPAALGTAMEERGLLASALCCLEEASSESAEETKS